MKSLIVLCLVAAAFASRDCGENQHYTSCGTACPLTCDNYDNPPKACILMCKSGCQCDEGYVKTEDGKCVKPDECPVKSPDVCGENERYSTCGTACPLTCDNYQNPPKFCNLMCKIGCECEPGYVRSNDGRCVRPENCPAAAECGENQHYTSCGTACPLTCDNYDNPPKACILMCKSGCQCDKGYVKTADGQCVKPDQCPAKSSEVCGENERYNGCGTACPLTCDNYQNPPKFCNMMCKIGCECESGYVRSNDGRCVRPGNCPVSTGEKSCLGEPETGMCRGHFPMFHYDVQTGTCKKFIYGGCGGNGNKYITEEQCLEHCGGISPKQAAIGACDMPAETGLCKGLFFRFHFDKTTGQCKKFIYGGCGGNENNFKSKEECENQCGVRADANLCTLPAETGRCKARIPRYYFDQSTGKCQQFIYGGCGGNRNNFRTLEECHDICA